MIYFTSDTHFNHANVIEYSKRPFKDIHHMTESLIENWNAIVQPGDVVYHLGDFSLSWGSKHAEMIEKTLRRLNGQKWLIQGNHDRKEVLQSPQWVKVLPYHEVHTKMFGGEHKQRIVLCHYAMLSWNQMHRGSWMLHGHSHGNLVDSGGKRVDVGVDVWDYKPVSIETIKKFMDKREVVTVDHHDDIDRAYEDGIEAGAFVR
jgi:calcineurin-like phosphoesterase family protein